jgi:hypothetical protein
VGGVELEAAHRILLFVKHLAYALKPGGALIVTAPSVPTPRTCVW